MFRSNTVVLVVVPGLVTDTQSMNQRRFALTLDTYRIIATRYRDNQCTCTATGSNLMLRSDKCGSERSDSTTLLVE